MSEVAEMREVASPILLASNKRAFSSQNRKPSRPIVAVDSAR